MSFVRQRSLVAFIAARVLRIYPGLTLAALLTVAIGMACSTLPWQSFLTDAQTLDYLRHTVSGWDVRDRLPGAFTGNPYPHAVNGSLWTLPIELKFYVGCLAAGVCGLFRRAWRYNAAFIAGIALFAWHPDWFPVHPELAVVRHLAFGFALGAFALHPALRIAAFNRLGDYSYGLYVYAFPVQQMLIYRSNDISPTVLFWTAFPLTLALAVASWHLVEKPMLELKRYTRKGSDPGYADRASLHGS